MNGYMKLMIVLFSAMLISNGLTRVLEHSNVFVRIYGAIQVALGIYGGFLLIKNRLIENK
ncbi:hypothetical protein R6U77_04445 [Lysinibacillus louembei]|uniref:Uncharacterized protein n=1 Tax=Lysinibacillus louembei TaxID=1470088 RepID=A0ABZ0S1M9_9BACI|nr:hypothetical protein [Lysinibacillus louembei]WPK12948.1 hypothetical protein R6U77_04445 [Lysinibacillus louembei]